MLVPFGLPGNTDSDEGTYFTAHSVWTWAVKTRHHLSFQSVLLLADSRLTEKHNGLLKDALLNLQNGQWSPKWVSLLPTLF